MFNAVWRTWLRRRTSPLRRRHRLLPRLEQLEDRVVPTSPGGTIAINDITVTQSFVGQAVTGTLNPGTETNTYRLNGFAGERVTFHWTSANPGPGNWSLYGPADDYVDGSGFGGDFTVTLPSDGPYDLVLIGNQTAAESYGFQTTDVTDPAVGVSGFGIEHSGTVNPGNSFVFSYTAPAGRLVLFDALLSTTNAIATLTDPTGAFVLSTIGSFDSQPIFLSRSGTYTLTVSNTNPSAQPFDFKFLDLQGSDAAPVTLGTLVTGTPSAGYSNNVYSFQGSVGQKLLFDGQGGNESFTLYGPGGVHQIFSASGGSDSLPVTLLENGTYYLVGYNNTASTGQYSWQLLDRSAAPTLDLAGGNTQGSLNPGNSVQLYQFNGTAGTRLFFDWQSASTGGGYYQVFGPNNTVLTGSGFGSYQYFGNPFDLTLPVDGPYTLALFGQNGATALSYQFKVFTPPAPVNNAAYALGQTVNGNLATAGQIDTYTFTGSPGQRLYFDGLADSSSSGIVATITSPTGIDLPGQSSTAGDLGNRTLTLTEAGTYQVTVRANGQQTGTYSFRLLDRAAAPVLDLTGGTTQGTLNPGNSVQLYQFNGTAGTRLFFNWQTPSNGNAYYQVFGADNNAVNSTTYGTYQYFGNPFDFTLPVSGPYTLALIGQNASTAAPFQFQVYTPPTPVNAVPYTIGQTVNGNLATAGQIDTYTFTGTPGQVLFFDGLVDGTNGSVNVTITSPTGSEILDQFNPAADLNGGRPVTLTAAGTYLVTVKASGQHTGTYSFRLLDRSAAPVLDVTGGTTQGSLSPGNSAQLFQLNGTAGTRLFFNWQTPSNGNAYYQIFGADNNAVNSTTYGSYQYFGNPFDFTVPVSGPYTLVLFGQASAGPAGPPPAVNYQFQVSTPPTPVQDASYSVGQTASGNLTAAGQIDTYTFSASLGQRLFFDGLSDSSNGNIRVVLTSPSGVSIFNLGASQDQDGVTITEPGTYRLTVRANTQFTGTYSFRLLDTSSATSLSLPANINGTAGANSYDLYTFSGRAGQTVTASLPTSTGNSAFLALYSLSGQRLLQFGTTSSASAGLPADGTYVLAVFANAASPVTYNFTLSVTNSTTSPGAISTQTGTLNNGASQPFQFNSPAGRIVYFDSLAQNFNLSYSITTPGIGQVAGGSLASDSGPIVLPAEGSYTLTVSNNSGSSQNYSFRLLDLGSAATAYSLGASVNNVTATGFGADVYSFSGTVGQTLVYDGLADSSSGSMNYSLIGPAGNIVYSGQTLTDSVSPLIVLPQAGTYYLIQTNTLSSSSTYGFRLLDTAAGTSLSLNNPRTDTLTPGSSANVYRFSGNAGQRVLVNFTAGSGGSYYLYGTAGNLLTSGSIFQGSFVNATLPVGGTYFLVVAGTSQNTSPVTYTFEAFTPTVNNAGIITLGSTVTGNINSAGQTDQYSVTGAVGQQIYFDGLTGDAASALYVRVFTPSGDNLFSYYPANDQGPYTLSEAGTYTITVGAVNNGPATGSYSFRLLDVASAQVIPFNTPTTGTLTPGTATQLYTFGLPAGQTIFFNSPSGSGGGVYLYDPTGRIVASAGLGSYFQYTAGLTGSYLLVVQGNNANNPVAYNIELFNPPTHTTSYTLGTTVSGSIDTPGQADHYTFTGTVGQKLYLDGIAGSSLVVQLTAPSGSTDGFSNNYVAYDDGPFTLTESGTFTLTISGNTGPTTGAYSFRLLDLAGTQPLTFATPASGTLSPGTTTQLYAVSGTAGQTVFFNTLSGSGAGVYLYKPNGEYLDSAGLGGYFRTTLPATGTYLLAVQGNDTNNPVPYGIELFNSPVNTASYTLGTVASGNIATPGQTDTYTFTGTTGQRLYIDGLTGSSSVFWHLTSPGGSLGDVSSGFTGGDQGPITLGVTGTYTLTVDASGGPATGPYSFRLLDEGLQPEILQGAVFTVTLSQASASPVTVDYATADNSAHVGVDYASASGTITFNPGETAKTVKVFLIPDPLLATGSTFFVNLSGANGATIADNQGVATINTPTGVATQLTATGIPATVTTGSPVSWTVTARDARGAVATGYTGTVTFSSTDPLASLPASYTFTAADQGQHTFAITFRTVGTQSMQVQDVAQPALTATQSGINVSKPVVSWSGGGDGTSWSDPLNWSGGAVPTAADDVVIGLAGSYTVNLNVNAAVNSLTFNAPTATFLNVGHTLTESAASSFTAGSVIVVNGTLAGSSLLTNSADLMIEGATSITSPFAQNGKLTVQGGDNQIYITGFTKNNNIYTNLNQQFPNTGPGVPGSGTGTPNATFLYDPSTYTSPNAITGSNLVNNGVSFLLSSNPAGQDFNQMGSGNPGTVTVPINVSNVSSVYTLMSAYFGTSVNVTFTGSGGATETFSNIALPDFNGGGAINQSFAVNGSATNNLFDQTVFQVQDVGGGGSDNSATGAFSAYNLVEQTFILGPQFAGQTLTSMTITANGATPLLFGVTVKGGAAPASSTLTVTSGFTNSGTIALQSDDAGFGADLVVSNGSLTNDTAGVLNFSAGAGGSRGFSGSLINNGTVNLGLDSVTFSGNVTNNCTFIKTGGTGTTSVAAFFDNPGTVEVDSGTLSLAGQVVQLSANQLTAGTWTVLNSSALNLAGPQVVNNLGVITLGGPNAVFTSISSLAQNSGTLNLLGGARLVLPANLDNAGTLFLDAGSAVVAGGNFVQDHTGSLTVGIGGTGSGSIGQINASGTATLDGSLTTTQVNGFTPSLDQYFPFMSFSGVTGDFTSKSLLYTTGQSYTTFQTGTQYSVTTQASADHIVISQQPTSTPAGQTISTVQVSFLDAANNLVQTQPPTSVTLTLASGPAGATLGGTVTVTSVNGVASFATLFLQKAGTYTLSGSAAGFTAVTSQSFVITPGAAAQLSVGGFPSAATAGISGNFTVTALDAFGNVATGFSSVLHFSSSDGQAILPADSTLTNGTGTFSATLKTAGTQVLTATQIGATGAPLSGSQAGIQVNPGAAVVLGLSGLGSPVTAGTPATFAITAFDAYSNVATSYNNPLHFTSSDSQAVLPADTSLVNGTGAFSVTFNTVGAQSVRATDSVQGLSVLRSGINVTAATATHFTISGLGGSVTAGVPQSIIVTAADGFGNVSANYSGTVHFTSSDGQAILPANATLTNGTGTFTVTFTTAGSQTVTASDTATPSLTGSQSTTVTPAAAIQFTLSGVPGNVTAGAANTLTVTAEDAFGNVATGYAGTVHFSSSDPGAVLPANATLTQGTGSFGVALTTAGPQSITVADTAGGPTASLVGIIVDPAAVGQITVSGLPSSLTAGGSATISVTAQDAFGNLATNYAGTIHFTSSDGRAVLPADAGLVNGTGSFTVSFRTAAAQSVTATDVGTQVFCSQTTTVLPGTATHLSLSGIQSGFVAGGTGTLIVNALDAFGNTASSYAGTLHFTSSDGLAVLPPDSALSQGTGTFNITLKTAGSQSITAADVAGSVSGSLAGIVVDPAAPTTLLVTGLLGTTVAGTPVSLGVTVKDAFGNVATNYGGTLHFASSDPQAALPSDGGLVNGTGTFTVALKTAGSATVSVGDAAHALSVSQSITVTPGAAAVAAFSGLAPSTAAGTSQSFTITIQDAFGNLVPGFTGSVAFSSTDSAATLPAIYQFVAADQGSHAFAATFGTVGTQTIAATLSGAGTTAAGQQSVAVVPGAVASAVVSGFPSPSTPGIPADFTVTLKVAFGNVATNLTGTVTFASSDPQAVLPGAYTFTSTDQGVHTFSAALATPGTQSLTVAVQGTSVQGTLTGLTVEDPEVSITGLDAARAGETYTLTLSATNLGTDAIIAWTINWGDGTEADVVPGSATSVTHVFGSESGADGFSINVTALDTRSAVLTVAPLVVQVTDDRVPTVSISGLDGVKVGETYTLTLSATNLGSLSIVSWSISWGDGTAAETFPGDATSVTHVYTTRDPNGFEIHAAATDSRSKVFNPQPLVLQLLTSGITERQVTSVAQGATATLKLSKIEATFTHHGAGDAVPSVVVYVGNITDAPFPGKVWVDFSVTNADKEDSADVTISYDGDVQDPALFFFDPASHSWQKFSGHITSLPDDPAQPGRHFLKVHFDKDSNPPIHKLTGTIFTVAVSTAATDVSTTVSPLTVSNLQGLNGSGASFLTNSQLSLSLTPLQQTQLSSSRSGLTGESNPNGGTEEEKDKEKEAQAETEDLWQIINDLFTNPPGQGEVKTAPPATGAAGEPAPAAAPGTRSGRLNEDADALDAYFAGPVVLDTPPAALSESPELSAAPPVIEPAPAEDYRGAAMAAFLGLAYGGRSRHDVADREERKRRALPRD